MSRKLALYFTADARVLYRWGRAGLELAASFGADEEGLEGFRAHLRGCRGALVTVLADLAGEDYHEDQIPFLRGGDRAAVIQRRLAQRFRDARLATAIPLGPAAGERRGERVLLASFTNAAQFTPWLDALAEAGTRLAGVYSVPLLAPALATRLGARSGRCFLVTANPGGLRQCFVEEGRLRFARLERAADLAAEPLALIVRSETSRLAQYLATLRALPRDGPPVQVVVVAPPGERAVFERTLVSDVRLSFHTVDLDEAARRLGMRRLAPGASAEQLYLHLAVRKPPKVQFARLEDRRAFFLWRLQRAVVGAGGAALAALGLYAGALWVDALQVRGEAETQRRQALEATRQYERITATFPVTQTSTDNLKATVVEFSSIAARTASPEAAFAHLSRVLGQFPQIELESLSWSLEAPKDAGAPKPAAKPVAAQPVSAAATAPGASAQFLEISGRVEAMQRSDYRGITQHVQRFAAALTADGAYRIAATKLPFDITPDATLSGDIGETADRGEAPRFTIVISRALP
jgi:hypothetical protein